MKKWLVNENFRFSDLEQQLNHYTQTVVIYTTINAGSYIYESENTPKLIIKGRAFDQINLSTVWKTKCTLVETLVEDEIGNIVGAGPYVEGWSMVAGSCSIVGNGTLATVTQTAHGYETYQRIVISGTTDFNGEVVITVTGANAYTFSHTYVGTESGTATPKTVWLNAIPDSLLEAFNRLVLYTTSHNVDPIA